MIKQKQDAALDTEEAAARKASALGKQQAAAAAEQGINRQKEELGEAKAKQLEEHK